MHQFTHRIARHEQRKPSGVYAIIRDAKVSFVLLVV